MVDEEPNKKINENNRRRVKNMKSLLCYTDVKIIYFNMKWENTLPKIATGDHRFTKFNFFS
jgi:hypothetical protein